MAIQDTPLLDQSSAGLTYHLSDLSTLLASLLSPKVILMSDLRFDSSFTVRASKTIEFQKHLFFFTSAAHSGMLIVPCSSFG